MAAPAASISTTSAVYLLQPNNLSTLAKELLSITPEHLAKHGFDHKPWHQYLETIFRPQHAQQVKEELRTRKRLPCREGRRGGSIGRSRSQPKIKLSSRWQYNSSGASVQKGNKGGSHHSTKLVKQDDELRKVTYRAATLVNKHGKDRSRGHNLSAQQSDLLRLFTPLA